MENQSAKTKEPLQTVQTTKTAKKGAKKRNIHGKPFILQEPESTMH